MRTALAKAGWTCVVVLWLVAVLSLVVLLLPVWLWARLTGTGEPVNPWDGRREW